MSVFEILKLKSDNSLLNVKSFSSSPKAFGTVTSNCIAFTLSLLFRSISKLNSSRGNINV